MDTAIIDKETPVTQKPPKDTKKLERRWFWISLSAFISLYITVSALSIFYSNLLELQEYYSILHGLDFIAAAVGILLVPILLGRFGVFTDSRKMKQVFAITALTGILAITALPFVVGHPMRPGRIPFALALQYISVMAPATMAGYALRRVFKVLDIKSVTRLAGFTVAFVIIYFLPAYLTLSVFTAHWPEVITFIVIYAIPIAASAVLTLRTRDDFQYTRPKEAKILPQKLSLQFIVLAVLFIFQDAFYESSYYAGGTFDDYGLALTIFSLVAPIAMYFVVTFLLVKGQWLVAMAGCTLFFCFQQGLILFFNNNAQLAVAYEIADAFSGAGSPIFLLYIGFMYCATRRDSGIATAKIMALMFMVNALASFLQIYTADSALPLATPAIAFITGIITVAFLFYLYNEYARNETGNLLAAIREGQVKQKTPRETLDTMALTPREKELAELLLTSEAQKNIADKMGISYATVRFHSNNLYRKLNIQSRAELFSLFVLPVPLESEVNS